MRALTIALPLLLAATPAAATDVFAGVHAHGVKTPLSLEADREGGTDLTFGIRGDKIFGTALQPYAYAQINTGGDTNFLAAGLSLRFGKTVYIRPALGLAVHDGSAANFIQRDRLAFGSRILFAPDLAVGVDVSERIGLEASWTHFSHGQLFGRQNPGIDNIGVRLNVRL